MQKHLSVLFLLFILAPGATAQDPDQAPIVSFHYKLLVEAPIYVCDLTGRPTEDTSVYAAPADAVFSVIGKAGNNLIIRFWVWSDNEPEKQTLFNYADAQRSDRKYFLLSQDDFSAKAVPRYSTRASFSAGAIIIPIKARFRTFDFSTDVHIGPAVGARFRLSPYSNTNFFNALATFGVSTISLDSTSTSGAVRQPTDRPALTFSVGGVLEFSNAQIGFFIGCDYISQNETTQWRYQGKPWISLGMGYSIISRNTTPQAAQEKRN
jgi:hypothetical protein